MKHQKFEHGDSVWFLEKNELEVGSVVLRDDEEGFYLIATAQGNKIMRSDMLFRTPDWIFMEMRKTIDSKVSELADFMNGNIVGDDILRESVNNICANLESLKEEIEKTFVPISVRPDFVDRFDRFIKVLRETYCV